ncbi:MAG TPA: ABC-type transport auxiliary lipoprotein family protein [Kofleriaceae bacterium]
MRALVFSIWLSICPSICLAGCALGAKAEPLELRYFSPEPASAVAAAEARAPSDAAPLRLRLGRITASSHLRYRIVHRDSAVAIDPYDALRWTEQPPDYVRRALSRALYEAHPLAEAISGATPTLEVEVTAFEEVVRPGGRAGRVQLRYQLHDERAVLARGVVTADRAAARADIEAVVAAIREAMDAACAELADRVVTQLRSPAAAP